EDRERSQRVDRAAAGGGPQPGAGADRELDHAHLAELGDHEVARLVRSDQEQEHPRDADHGQERVHVRLRLPEDAAIQSRVQRSAPRMSSRLSPHPGNTSSARSTVRTMALNGISWARNALTASSLAALSTAGWPRPSRAASRASRTAGNRLSSRS